MELGGGAMSYDEINPACPMARIRGRFGINVRRGGLADFIGFN